MAIMAQHDVSGLPMILDHSSGEGVWRVCGRIKTDRPKMQIQPFADFLDGIAPPSTPNLLASIPDYDRFQTGVPILDQQQVGSCVGHSHTTAIMKARDLAGATYIPLSPDGLYAWINGGQDNGADPADAIAALTATGVPTLADVPDNFILLSAISAAAKTNALRFRIVPAGVYKCANFAEMVTADYLGFSVTLTINVGNNFGPDSTGLVGFAGGFANHSVSAGEAKRTVNGTPQFRFRNSWNTSWGINGCAWCTATHIDKQMGVELYAIQWPLLDPQDPLNPPLV